MGKKEGEVYTDKSAAKRAVWNKSIRHGGVCNFYILASGFRHRQLAQRIQSLPPNLPRPAKPGGG
jgi:hypothetical protein